MATNLAKNAQTDECCRVFIIPRQQESRPAPKRGSKQQLNLLWHLACFLCPSVLMGFVFFRYDLSFGTVSGGVVVAGCHHAVVVIRAAVVPRTVHIEAQHEEPQQDDAQRNGQKAIRILGKDCLMRWSISQGAMMNIQMMMMTAV